MDSFITYSGIFSLEVIISLHFHKWLWIIVWCIHNTPDVITIYPIRLFQKLMLNMRISQFSSELLPWKSLATILKKIDLNDHLFLDNIESFWKILSAKIHLSKFSFRMREEQKKSLVTDSSGSEYQRMIVIVNKII